MNEADGRGRAGAGGGGGGRAWLLSFKDGKEEREKVLFDGSKHLPKEGKKQRTRKTHSELEAIRTKRTKAQARRPQRASRFIRNIFALQLLRFAVFLLRFPFILFMCCPLAPPLFATYNWLVFVSHYRVRAIDDPTELYRAIKSLLFAFDNLRYIAPKGPKKAHMVNGSNPIGFVD